ncbi:PTS sugar transporter subunit IIA [Candidatus Latescibacterota bacterium]
MDLETQLLPECIHIGLEAEHREDVLREVARLAAQTRAVGGLDAEAIYGALTKRETAASTGLEHGVAIPHARLPELTDFLLGVVTVPEGVDFGSAYTEATRIVVFMLGPVDRPDEHLRMLSTVSRVLDASTVRSALLDAATVDEVRQTFLGAAPRQSTDANAQRALVTVFVQREEVFADLLEAVSSETTSLAVSEVRDASHYLHAMPLYSTLWQEEEEQFHRVITGVVDMSRVEGVVRQMESILRREEVDRGVLITAQNLELCSGSLHS